MKIARYILPLMILLGLVVAATRYLDPDQLALTLRRFDPAYLLPLFLASVLFFGLKGVRFCYLQRRIRAAPSGMIMRAYLAGQACSVLPGGIAARAVLLREGGIPVPESLPPITMSGIVDRAVLLLGSLLAALWFEPARLPVLIVLALALLGGMLVGLAPTRRWMLALADRFAARLGAQAPWREMVRSLAPISAPRVLLNAAAMSIVSTAAMVAALDFSLRSLGSETGWQTCLLASVLPGLLGRLSALPAGVGVTEAGMLGLLRVDPGLALEEAAAAVMLFRLGTVLLEVALGALVYLFAWRGTREASASAAEMETGTRPQPQPL